MPNAYEIALQLYAKYPDRSLVLDIDTYARTAYCYCSPECLILARIENSNTWFIHLAAGPGALHRFMQLAPFPLPFVAFARPEKHDKVNIYRWERILTLCKSN